MRRLATPPARYRRDLRAAATDEEWARHRAHLDAACRLAHTYTRRPPALARMRSTVAGLDDVRDFFVSLYGSRRSAVTQIKSRVREGLDSVTASKCQYCGLDSPKTLDHYLEKAKLPELALFTQNLIPCCWECNHGRGAAFSPTGEQQILHLYRDDVDGMPEVLTADVAIAPAQGEPVAEYSVAASNHPLVAIYARHFDQLGLARRYRSDAARELTELRDRVPVGWAPKGKREDRLKAELASLASSRSKTYGPNDHLSALYRGIVASPAVLDWLLP